MMNVHQNVVSGNVNFKSSNSIMVIAEHPVVVEGVKYIIQATMPNSPFLSSHSISEAKKSFPVISPEIVIIDTIFGNDQVLDFIQWLREFDSDIKTLILTDDANNQLCIDSFKLGARGCFLKNSPPEKIRHSLLMAQEGRLLLDEVFLNAFVNMDSAKEKSTKCTLKPRDIQILKLVAQGNTNQEISEQIYISSRTVQGRLSKIFAILEVKTRTEAVSKAIQLGHLK